MTAPVPERLSLRALKQASAACTACDLHRDATQTVFGDGLVRSDVMIVGEQPGDREDLEGEPFVGPAGRLLWRNLERAGLARDRVYVTNTVKHFKWKPRGKRRIHQRPDRQEIEACHPWLEAELQVIAPRAVLLLGATAAKALLGPDIRVTKDRGRPIESTLAPLTMVTVHPSSVLRARDDRAAAEQAFEHDLQSFTTALSATATEHEENT